jgi:hypothetical protein
MLSLARKLWTDQVGSSLSTEMALVTSVTIGALFMSMGNFSQTVNQEFDTAVKSPGLSIEDVEKKKKQAAEQRLIDKEARELELENKRKWFREQKGES